MIDPAELGGLSNLDRIIEGIIIDPERRVFSGNIKPGIVIESGHDSLVCHIGSDVYNFYGKGEEEKGTFTFWKQTIDFYNEVTSNAIKFCDDRKFSFTAKDGRIYPFRINPITSVLSSTKYDVVAKVSPYIGGPQLPNSELADDKKVGDFLYDVKTQIANRLKVSGINFNTVSYNVKVPPNELVVTDLCGVLYNLRRKRFG